MAVLTQSRPKNENSSTASAAEEDAEKVYFFTF